MPNTFAYVVLFTWPLVMLAIFRVLPRPAALISSILAGYLLLPFRVGINPPILPTLDKDSIPAITAVILCFVFVRDEPLAPLRKAAAAAPSPGADGPRRPPSPARGVRGYTRQQERRPGRVEPAARPGKAAASLPEGRKIGNLLLALLIATPFVTFLRNGDPVQVGPRVLPGLQLYDAFSMVLGAGMSVLPFILARRHLATAERHVLLLRGLCIAGLAYSLPALLEIRLSPQISRWVYGFLSQNFGQAMRDGGFRPVVFLQHGLWLAIFNAMTILAALVLWRHEKGSGRATAYLLSAGWITGVLLLSHSFGATAVLLVLAPIVMLAPVRLQVLAAMAIAVVMLAYPTLRGTGYAPTETMSSIAAAISPERADSLNFRFRNEDILLAHASEKRLAGWGGWGRSRVQDPVTGKDVSTTDGMWVIIIGVSGWMGYVAQFGLLACPLILLALFRRSLNLEGATSGLCLVLAANLIDLIPNATLTPVTWLIAGALMGRYDIGTNTPGGAGPANETSPSGRRAPI